MLSREIGLNFCIRNTATVMLMLTALFVSSSAHHALNDLASVGFSSLKTCRVVPVRREKDRMVSDSSRMSSKLLCWDGR